MPFLLAGFWLVRLICWRVAVCCGIGRMCGQRFDHSLSYLLDHGRQVDDSGNVVCRKLDVMSVGQVSGFRQRQRASRWNDGIELAAVKPGCCRVYPMGQSKRLDLVCGVSDLLIGNSGGREFGSCFRNFLGAVEQHFVQVAAGQEYENAIVTVVEPGNRGCDKAAQACSLQTYDGAIDFG